ncbi:peptidylprolyl isomerase [Candidatus Bathyarchaeota archaeon]|nr:peptidylprolyl isomerase [Candidatus Bathyarchaeota archaeon]MBS7629209.1 peptidylprolyl isomerase [Candidatus Bathyarchaeota archaeon]
MPLSKGDFILINLTSKIKESGEVIETTMEDVAKESNIYSSENIYEPRFIIVGERWVPEGLDEALLSLESDKEVTVEVPPGKGYGERDPSKIRLIPLRRFRGENLTPVPGSRVEIDGRPAVVRSVGAGRVQVDFNHPLAGKTMLYNVKLVRKLEEPEEKLKALIHRRLPTAPIDKFKITVDQNECRIELPRETFFVEGLQLAKREAAADIYRFMPNISKVEFVESYPKPEGTSAGRQVEAAPQRDMTENP